MPWSGARGSHNPMSILKGRTNSGRQANSDPYSLIMGHGYSRSKRFIWRMKTSSAAAAVLPPILHGKDLMLDPLAHGRAVEGTLDPVALLSADRRWPCTANTHLDPSMIRNPSSKEAQFAAKNPAQFWMEINTQDNALTARNQWRGIASQLGPKLATLMDAAQHDMLAHLGFPAAHRIKSTAFHKPDRTPQRRDQMPHLGRRNPSK